MIMNKFICDDKIMVESIVYKFVILQKGIVKNMKKDTVRAVVISVIVFLIYNLITFMVPFAHTAAFWISYGFTVAAFAVVLSAFYIAFMKNPDAKSRFYGFPIAVIGAVYGVAQLAVSFVAMLLAALIPWWIAVIVYAVGFGVAVIGLIGAQTSADEIRIQDSKQQSKTDLMRTLHSKVSLMALQSENTDIKALAEELRYSDPVSSDAIADIEAELLATVNELQAALADDNNDSATQICRKAIHVLAERNRLCKLNKSRI